MLCDTNTLGQVRTTLKNTQSQSQLEYCNQDRAALILEVYFLPCSRIYRMLKLSLQDQAVTMANFGITILKQKNFVLENTVIRQKQQQRNSLVQIIKFQKLPHSSSHRIETTTFFLFSFFKYSEQSSVTELVCSK